jgi:hypothetical protein
VAIHPGGDVRRRRSGGARNARVRTVDGSEVAVLRGPAPGLLAQGMADAPLQYRQRERESRCENDDAVGVTLDTG